MSLLRKHRCALGAASAAAALVFLGACGGADTTAAAPSTASPDSQLAAVDVPSPSTVPATATTASPSSEPAEVPTSAPSSSGLDPEPRSRAGVPTTEDAVPVDDAAEPAASSIPVTTSAPATSVATTTADPAPPPTPASTTAPSTTTPTTTAPTTSAEPTAIAPPTTAPFPATYRIAPGNHSATVVSGSDGARPLAGFTSVSGRSYDLGFDSSAAYVLTSPTQPNDQLDWNKTPGFSDCGTLDLSHNGAMFGWRWNVASERLEITAYANNDGTHLWTSTPLVELSAAELAGGPVLRFDVHISADAASYDFSVSGNVGGRAVNAVATHPRQCIGAATNTVKWASGLYFGGTSTAPHEVWASIVE